MWNSEANMDNEAAAAEEAIGNAKSSAPVAPAAEQKVPEGWKLVPIDPPMEMIEALAGVVSDMFGIDDCEDGFRSAYEAMLAVAPSFEKEEGSHE
ncbi:hypothetical protein D3C81_1799920 [compost metagenome]